MKTTTQTPTRPAMQGEHAPGPWIFTDKAQGSDVPTAGVFYVYPECRSTSRIEYNDVATVEAQGGIGEQRANAALIAAAPDLLAALDILLGCILMGGDPYEGKGPLHPSSSPIAMAKSAIDKAKAKAMGGAQ